MKINVIDDNVSKATYKIQDLRKIFSLAYEYEWETTRYDELQSKLAVCLQMLTEIQYFKEDECYVTLNDCLNEEDKPSIVDALDKAIEDIPDKAFHTDDFNPGVGGYRMEALDEKKLYYKLIYWGWDDKKQDLLYFIEDLRDEANTNSRVDDPAPPASHLHLTW